ncbi:MAG: Transposase domain [Bacteroidetes bacterium]|nr:Transposase domain [Bacteroidota bacterium]
MQGKMTSSRKKRAQVPEYVSRSQLKLAGFESPFDQELNPTNHWVVLAHLIPWDEICNLYFKFAPKGQTGRPPLNPRVVIGSLIIKHMCNLDDRETVDQISENIYMQYFLGYLSFTNESPFDASLFVEFRKRLGMDNLNAINKKIVAIKTRLESSHKSENQAKGSEDEDQQSNNGQEGTNGTSHKGRVIYDATACPQDIAYPTDLNLLNDAREKLEELIGHIHTKGLHGPKPRTYREVARKKYLQTAQRKNKSRKVIRKAKRCQLNFVRRDIAIVNELLEVYRTNNLKFPLNPSRQKYLFVVQTLYGQQKQMYDADTHSTGHRIVSIHQPHMRPIARGKAQAKVEFGSKIHVSIINGISFLDELSWDAFNEGSHMMATLKSIENASVAIPVRCLPTKSIVTEPTGKH